MATCVLPAGQDAPTATADASSLAARSGHRPRLKPAGRLSPSGRITNDRRPAARPRALAGTLGYQPLTTFSPGTG